MRWRSVVYGWFVRYNPLTFASAACVLAGVFLFARELPAEAFGSKAAIAAVTEIYQLMLIAGAWLLLRVRQTRPAALLGLVALLFMLDVAFNGERILSHVGVLSLEPGMRARSAVPASALLAILGPLKLWALARVFRLRGAGPALAVAGAALAALPALPYAIEAVGPCDALRQGAHLLAFWAGALLLGWAFHRRSRAWTSEWTGDERARRIAVAAPFLVVALFVAHAVTWSTFPGLVLTPAHAAPYLLVGGCAVARRLARSSRWAEPLACAGAASAVLAGLHSTHETGYWAAAAVALLSGAALFRLIRRAGLRLLLPAIACAFGGAYLAASGARSPLPVPQVGWPAAVAVSLLAGAAWHRDFRCLFASAIAAGSTLVAWAPGAVLVPFGILLSGIWLACWSWRLFPELRWVPFAAAAGVLAVGAALLWRDPLPLSPWYAATAATAAGAGFALGRRELQAAGLASLVPLAAATRAWWLPQTAGGAGVALVAAGFLLLSAGIALNLILARRTSPAGEG